MQQRHQRMTIGLNSVTFLVAGVAGTSESRCQVSSVQAFCLSGLQAFDFTVVFVAD